VRDLSAYPTVLVQDSGGRMLREAHGSGWRLPLVVSDEVTFGAMSRSEAYIYLVGRSRYVRQAVDRHTRWWGRIANWANNIREPYVPVRGRMLRRLLQATGDSEGAATVVQEGTYYVRVDYAEALAAAIRPERSAV